MAQSCHRVGDDNESVRLWAVDQFADRDCVEVSEQVSQLSLQEVSVDYFADYQKLLFLPGGGTENHASLVDSLANRYCWCGLTGDALRKIRDPQILFPLALAAGLSIPATYYHKTHPNPQSFAVELFDLQKNSKWLWKSADKGGGLGVSRIETLADLELFCHHADPGYIQQQVDGEPFGSTIIISANGEAEWIGASRLLTASEQVEQILIQAADRGGAPIRKVITREEQRRDYPFLFAGAIGPHSIPTAVVEQLLALARKCFHTFGIKGWFQVDFILDKNERAWVLEINPRWSATMEIYERALGRSLTSDHLRAWGIELSGESKHSPIEQLTFSNTAYWKDVVYAEREFLWTEQHLEAVLKFNEGALLEAGWPVIADIPTANQVFEIGMPVFTTIVSGRNEQELRRSREAAIAGLRA